MSESSELVKKQPLLSKIRNHRKTKRLTVNEIIQTLSDIQLSLEDHTKERNGQLNRLDAEMKKLESEKQIAVIEKTRGEKIRENISKLLDT